MGFLQIRAKCQTIAQKSSKYSFTVTRNFGEFYRKQGVFSIQSLPGSLLRETPSCVTIVKKSANQLSDACKKGNKQDITAKHKELAQTIASTELAAKMEQFDAHHEDSPLFKFTRGYMAMVMEMMTFIRAVQTGDGDLHLEAYSCL